MDLIKRRPVDHNEAMDPADESADFAKSEARLNLKTVLGAVEEELIQARLLVGRLEALIHQLREKMSGNTSGNPEY